MKNKKLLVVDDVDDLRISLASLLEDEGFSVMQASNGNKASEIMKKHAINLLITDIFMPEKDGLELAIEARSLYPQIKIILISGGTRTTLASGHQYDYLKSGQKLSNADYILKKPFSPLLLIKTCTKLLQTS